MKTLGRWRRSSRSSLRRRADGADVDQARASFNAGAQAYGNFAGLSEASEFTACAPSISSLCLGTAGVRVTQDAAHP
jgi:hypothetical protein